MAAVRSMATSPAAERVAAISVGMGARVLAVKNAIHNPAAAATANNGRRICGPVSLPIPAAAACETEKLTPKRMA
jgi:hypothetical protein